MHDVCMRAWTILANLAVCLSGSLAAVFGAYLYSRIVRVEGWRVPVHVPVREYTHKKENKAH
jgi:hypothetical protein